MSEGKRPGLSGWIVRMLIGRDLGENLLGDLVEQRTARSAAGRPRWATLIWYWREVLSLLRPALLWRGNRPARTGPRRGAPMFLQDIRYAWRSLLAQPGFALMAIVTLALGIAGTTTVVSAMDGFVLRPFPFPDQSRLITVGSAHPKSGGELTFFEHLSPAEFLDIKRATSLEGVVAWDLGNRQVTVGETTENLFSAFWWGDGFATTGLPPFLGRGFSEEETVRGDRVAVISYRVWNGRFGADSALVGGKILVNGEPYTVIGVMQPGALLFGTDLWLPFGVGPEVFPRDRRMLQVLARLKPGVSMATVASELEVLARVTEKEHRAALPEYQGWRLVPSTWTDANIAELKLAAVAMLGAILFVMLLVCTNVATLLLGRSAVRTREMALRGALGASRGQLLRQLLTESLLLSVLGATAGIGLGMLGIRGVNRVLQSLPVSLFNDLSLNGPVLIVTVAVALAAGLLFGTVPALQVLRADLRTALHNGAALGGTRSRLRLQKVLIGVEAALALSLLAGCGYLLRSLAAMRSVDPGLEQANVLTLRLTLAPERYRPEAIEPFFATVRERVGAIPGVSSVASGSQFAPITFGRGEFSIEGVEEVPGAARPFSYTTIASPSYFATLGIPLRRGRIFGGDDRQGGSLAVVVNEVMALRYFPERDPIGQRIRVGPPDSPWATIVGVVGATRNRGLDEEPAPEMFVSSLQLPGENNQMFLLVRTEREPRALLGLVRAAIQSVDPDQPLYAVRTIAEAFQHGQLPRRLSVVAFTLFGGVALLIAIVGLYGVVSYATAQRTREIGVRVALGAARTNVTRLFVRQAMAPVLVGTAIGLIAAWGIGRALSSLLFQVQPGDTITLAGAAGLLVVAGTLASAWPAFLASRNDPAVTLRQD